MPINPAAIVVCIAVNFRTKRFRAGRQRGRFLRRPETDGNSINYPLAAAICQYDKEHCAASAAAAAPEP
jgi:hypothetical protein